ncbi:phosphotransferase family protein [Phytoactinopolyspora mesophila]|nr:aminoglycoside phosphotransferase family protein [Phytoactinopolyspora mesophila]
MTSHAERTESAIAHAVLAEANRAHGMRFQLDRRMDRGAQSGAWLLTNRAGEYAVLKWSPNRHWAAQVLRAADVVASVRAVGYPTPAWLAVGVSDDGLPYQIQELVPGSPVGRVTVDTVPMLIDLVESQRCVDPDPERCWSQYVTTTMTSGRTHLWQQVAGIGPIGRELLGACEQLLAAHEPVFLPSGDLVHGDFRPDNIIFDAGRISGVVDIEALGSGSRVYDYATLLSAHNIEPGAQQMIIAAGEQVAGPGPFAYCFAHVVLELAVFVHQSNLETGVGDLLDQRRRVVQLIP